MDAPPVGANGTSAPAPAAAAPNTDAVAPATDVRTDIPLDAPADAPPVVAVGDEANRALKGGAGFWGVLCKEFTVCCCIEMCSE